MPDLLDGLPPWKGALEPILPVVIYRRGEDDHEGELEEENAVEYEGFGFFPCFEALGDDIGARVNGEGGKAGDCDRRELHREEQGGLGERRGGGGVVE